ncbi:Por secretion system C-terminal sorting domain-containing protein [Chryseobacterium sp. RU37D]|uniref:T9SS type A sorting domain-containing protein n=1 Tax=Chryseobacterium sp. RU37D TaxID=1907397 RepID=UPI0009550CA0|nr:T9SS type A sorting domain-containing protein [Chryseobacterium sp. RU37D]SIQ17951.1 Por secretion system C-terminal sorting domain-containing protein [Chryseobacterium sp. RU37D]
MKKLYSLLATVLVASSFFAQTVFSATFDDVTGTGGNDGGWSGSVAGSGFTDGNTSYTTGGAWTFAKIYKGNQCLKAGTSSAKGTVTTPTINLTGNGTLTFRAGAWNGASEVTTLNVSATGAALSVPSVTLTKGAFGSYTVNITGATGAVTLTFEGSVAANNRFFIDDIVVTANTTLAVSDLSKTKGSLVKNTFVKNEEITFGAQAKDVKVYNMYGQVVKTASVKENESLNVSDLQKGSYIVTGTVNNQPISQKILKD